MNSVNFGNSKIRYKVKKSSRRKTTQINVSRSGVQVITCAQKNHKQIENLVKTHSKWIYKKQLMINKEPNAKISYLNGTRLPYLGKNYHLVIKKTNGKESFTLRHGKFIVAVNKFSIPKIRRLYIEWLKRKSLPILEKSVSKYSKKIGLTSGKIIIKNQKNRWGSLSKKGTLNFNQNLVRTPAKIIDYLAAHEVCHLKIPNHSTSYWRLLESIMPDYENRKDWLRVNRSLLIK